MLEKMRKILPICIIFILIFFTHLFGNIVNFTPGAKNLASGNASTASCNDITSLFFNPAGLAKLNKKQIYGSFKIFKNSATYWFTGASIPYKKNKNFGIGFIYQHLFSTPPVLNNNFAPIPSSFYSSPSSQLLLKLGYGTHYNNPKNTIFKMDIGIGVKLLSQKLFRHLSYGTGFDFGIKIYPQIYYLKNLKIGINFKSSIKMFETQTSYPIYAIPKDYLHIEDSDWYLPELKFGASYSFLKNKILFNIDLSKTFSTDSNIQISSGISYKILKLLEISAGYYNGYTCGIGLNFANVKFYSGFNNNYDTGFGIQFDLILEFN